MKIWKYGNMENGNMEIWKYGNMEIQKYGNMDKIRYQGILSYCMGFLKIF